MGGRKDVRCSEIFLEVEDIVDHLQAMAPHLTAIAARIDELWAAGKIWPGERCVMSDVIMLAASRAGDASLQSQARKQSTNSRWMSLHAD